MEGREIPEMLMKTQKCCTKCCYWAKFVSCWSWGLHWQIPENATQWIWEMSDGTRNKGMHDFHYSKALLQCTYHPTKLWDKTGIWSLCFIESILHLRGVSWGISEPWVNILFGCLTHFPNDMVEHIQRLIKFPAIPKRQQVLEKHFSSMSQTASSLSWK